MNTFEMQIHVLARMVRTGNNETITMAVEKLKTFEPSPNVCELIDEANLPFLVEKFAPNNESAVYLIKCHREWKEQDMDIEKKDMLETYRTGLMDLLGNSLPDHSILHMLTIMLHMRDRDYSKTAVCLFRDLNFLLEEYMEILPFLERIRGDFPEVDELIHKILTMLHNFGAIPDEGYPVEEDVAGLNADDSFISNHDVSFVSTESGYHSENEDEALAREMEELQEAYRRHMNFQYAFGYVYMKDLAEAIKFGNSEMIRITINMFPQFQFPLTEYRRFEIAALIQKYGFHCEHAVKLLKELDFFKDQELNDEVYIHIFNHVQEGNRITPPMMDIMMGYLTESDRYMDQILGLFIDKEVPLELFQKHNVKQFLYDQPENSDIMMRLILKIRRMEAEVQII